MNHTDFESGASGSLVKTSTAGIDHYAFVPNPLPPEIAPTRELWLTLSDADRALGELGGIGRQVANPQLLVQPFIRREAVLSSKIEGTRATIQDVYAFEAGETTNEALVPDGSDVKEVHNYVVALEYGISQIEHRAISVGLLRELHERLLHGVRGGQDRPGELRDVQNWIGTSDDIREAKFVPPPVVQMRDALDRLAGYFEQHDELPPIVRVAVCHYQFEAIHPFRDGNGRIGRLLIILLLLRWKLLPNSLLYLSAYLEREREVYYRLLLDVSRKGNWHDWINFFVRGVAEQSKDAAERVKRLQALQAKWKQLMEKDATKAMMMTCDSLFIKPHFTLPDLSKRLGISYNTARSAADRLAKLGILTAFPFPRYKAYAALDISAIVQSSQVIQ